MSTSDLKMYMMILIAVVYSLAAFSYNTGDLDSVLTKEKFAADLIKNKKAYYHNIKKGDVEGAENYLQKVFALRHQLDEQCKMDSLVLIEYNEYLNECMHENRDFIEAEKACAVTKEYAEYIIDLSFRLQDQLRKEVTCGNQDTIRRKIRECNYFGAEMNRLDKLYPEFDKNSSAALFYRMAEFF